MPDHAPATDTEGRPAGLLAPLPTGGVEADAGVDGAGPDEGEFAGAEPAGAEDAEVAALPEAGDEPGEPVQAVSSAVTDPSRTHLATEVVTAFLSPRLPQPFASHHTTLAGLMRLA